MKAPQTSEGQQFCSSCKQELPLDSFSPGNRGKRGSWCRPCLAAYNKGRRPNIQHDPIECDECGKEFVPKQVKPGQRRFCSGNCKQRNLYRRQHPRVTRECLICSADITDRRSDTVYCSRECANAQRRLDGRLAAIARKSRLRRYGINESDLQSMLDQQGGGCAICGSADPKTHHGQWHVDHDHACCPNRDQRTCGACVRGVLCGRCNTGLGQFEDDPERLIAAAEYLRKQ